MKWLRKIKAKLTGKKPCSFDYAHGHDFKTVCVRRYSGIPCAKLVCKVCGKRATADSFSGLEIEQ